MICQDSDIECYADYSDTGSDTDVELSEAVSIFLIVGDIKKQNTTSVLCMIKQKIFGATLHCLRYL